MTLGVFQGRFGRVSVFETDQPVHQHAHPQFHVVINVSGADGAYEVEGHGPCSVTRDRLMLLNPWVAHANWRSAGAGRTTLLALYLEASWVRNGEGGPYGRDLFSAPSATMTPQLRAIVDRLVNMLISVESTSGDEIEAALHQALETAVAAYGTGATLPVASRFLDGRIRRAVAAMRREARTGIDLDAVCREVGLSRSRFYERFRTGLGILPRLYADGLRLEAAIEALALSAQPIGDIALDLGFSAQGHFARFFKDKTGFSPGAYRRGMSELVVS